MAYRALVIPDTAVTLWESETTITQAGPRAGVPEPDQSGSMSLGASGIQDADTSIDIRTQRGGHPVRGGATSIWRRTGEADAYWRGWDPPIAISGWEAATWTDGSGAPEYTRYPHVVDADGTLLCVVAYRDTGATDEYGVRVYRRPAGASAWTGVDVRGQATAPTEPALSCLMVLPSGRIHLYSVVAVGTVRTVVMYYSDDDGAAWSYGGDVLDQALTGASSATIRSIRAAYYRGQALLLVNEEFLSGIPGRVSTYASDDQGISYQITLRSYAGGTSLGTGLYLDLATGDGGFVVAGLVCDNNVGRDYIRAHILGDAYALLPDFEGWTNINETLSRYFVAAAGVTLTRLDDGALLLYWVDGDATPTAVIGRWSISWDAGGTWTSPQDADYIRSAWWRTTTPDYPSAITACAYRGRVALLGNWVASTGDEDDSVGVWWLGGHATVTQPPLYRTTDWRTRAVWTQSWVPIELPGDMGWTAGGAGTQALTTPGHLAVSCTAAQTRTYTVTPTTDPDLGMRVRVVVRPTSGGSTATDRHAIRCRVADGVESYDISVRFSTTQFAVYDNVAGAFVGAASAIIDLTDGIEFMIGLSTASVQVWYRLYTPEDTDRVYTLGVSSTTLSDGGATAATISWGTLAASGTTDTCEWIEVHYASDADAGAQPWSTTTYPVDLQGRDYGDGVYVDAGVSLVARDGPTWRGEGWVIATRYEYGISRALSVPSPRAGWRSTSTTSQVLALQLDSVGARRAESPYLAVVLVGSTLTRVLVETHDGSAWSSVGTVDLGWTGLGYTRSGRAAVPSGSAGLWLDYGEARDGSMALSTTVARRVTAHAEGRWDASYDLRPALELAAAESSDPASGTGTLTPTQVVILIRVSGSIQGVRLTQATAGVSAAPPPDAYWQVGSIVVGWLRLLDDPDWGTSEATTVDVEIDEARDGSTRSRRAGPTRRRRTVAWQAARDLTEHRDGYPSERLTLGSSPATARHGTPISIPAIIDRLSGGHTPCVYLPSVPTSLGDLAVLRRRRDALYGRVSSEIIETTIYGEEGVDESSTLGEMTITEEV